MVGAVELIKLSKSYDGKPAVIDVDISIASGQHCCLLGPSGCGKSTTLRMMRSGSRCIPDKVLVVAALKTRGAGAQPPFTSLGI